MNQKVETAAPCGNGQTKDKSTVVNETKVVPLNKYGRDLTNLLSAAVAISQIPESENVKNVAKSMPTSTSMAVSDDDTTKHVLVDSFPHSKTNSPHLDCKMHADEIYYQSCYDANGLSSLVHPNQMSVMHSLQHLEHQNCEKKKRPYNNTRTSFPSRFMQLLSSPDTSADIIRWSADGTCFHILDPTLLCETILPIYFPGEKKVKFHSFVRKLNRWGFRQTCRNSKTNVFYHKLFLRDRPDLCNGMICKQGERMGSYIKSFGKSFCGGNNLHGYPIAPKNDTMYNLFQSSHLQYPAYQEQYFQSEKIHADITSQSTMSDAIKQETAANVQLDKAT